MSLKFHACLRTGLILLSLFFILFQGCKSSQPTASGNNFLAPGYKKEDYKKILVLALVKPERNKKQMEDAIAGDLKDRRYPTVPAYKDFPEGTQIDTASFRKRVIEAGYDAAIVVSYLGQVERVQEHTQYDGTFFSIFYGYYSMFDVGETTVGNAFFQVDFFTKDKVGTQWRAPIRVNTTNDLPLLLQMIARNLRIQITGDNII